MEGEKGRRWAILGKMRTGSLGWQQRDGARPERWRWRDFERERDRVGEGGMHCSFPGDCALPALRGRRHDNHHGCRCHSFITPLSSPSPPIPRSLSLFPPPLLRSVSFSSLPSRRLLHSRLIPASSPSPSPSSFSRSSTASGGKKHPDEKMAVVFHLYSSGV